MSTEHLLCRGTAPSPAQPTPPSTLPTAGSSSFHLCAPSGKDYFLHPALYLPLMASGCRSAWLTPAPLPSLELACSHGPCPPSSSRDAPIPARLTLSGLQRGCKGELLCVLFAVAAKQNHTPHSAHVLPACSDRAAWMLSSQTSACRQRRLAGEEFASRPGKLVHLIPYRPYRVLNCSYVIY